MASHGCTARAMTREPSIEIDVVHHISLPVRDLARSMDFYGGVLGLHEIDRPPFPFPGAWYRLGAGQLHLIVHDRPTFRAPTGPDPRDVHFAVRVRDYRRTLELLLASGFRTSGDDCDPKFMKVFPKPTAGFPQIFIVDPDHHVIEINTDRLDATPG